MNRQTLMKSTLCLLMAQVCNVAWAQDVPVKQTTAPEDGYYLMYSESSSGNGWVHYNKSLSERKFRVATDVDLTNGVNADQANYVWKLVNDSESGTFTLQNVGEGVYMPADASRNQNMGATITANFAIEAVGGNGNEGKWFVSQTNYTNSGNPLYIHTNAPGGYPNLSYWDSKSVGGTSICAQFYKVPEITYTINFMSGADQVATSSLVYPAGITVPENVINDAAPVGYEAQSSTLEGTTYTVSVVVDFVAPETGKYYKIKGDNSQYPWLTGTLKGNSIVVSADEEDAAVFEKTTNGLMALETGKYLGLNGTTVSLVDKEGTVTIGEHENNADKLSVKVGTHYMYNNNTDGITHESASWRTDIPGYWGFIEVEMQTQTYTINYQLKGKQVATTTLVYPVDFEVPEALINNAVPTGYLMQNYTLDGMTYTVNVQTPTSTDGPIVTFTNVQKDGTTTFTLFINENNQLDISNSSAADLGNAAKFRATLLPNGKYTYYNEEKELYMIWKGSSGGYNSNKGVLSEYNATYCDWSVNQSTNLELGYLLVSKRANDSDGSLVIMKATGAFDAFGNSEGWHDNYSNLYRIDIVEQAPRTTDFVYNVTDGAYASNGFCKSWASNDAAKPNLTISVDVNNVNGGQANGIGLRPGQAGSATYTVTAGCTMLSLSFEAKGTNNHKISINGVEKAVGTQWKRFVIHNINAATAEFILKGDNGNDCLLRNVRFVTPALPLRAEVEGSWADNPNTHFGRVTATAGNNVTTMNLTKDHEETTHMLYGGGVHEIDFTREYRGFEFQGFFLGEENLGKSFTLTEAQEANITEQNPLVAKFTATAAVTLFYDDDEFSYRIPAIATTSTGRLIAVSDYRHNLDDIGRDKHYTGKKRLDLVMRYSDNNGKTWSATKTIAAGDDTKEGQYNRAFGDAAIATVGEKIVVMSAAGDVLYTNGSLENPNRMARIFSEDNGETWSIEEMTTKLYSTESSLLPNVSSAFFGSGKLAVDLNFNNTENARIYGALLVKIGGDNYNNFVVYSDDLGANWKILGGSQTSIADGDEPKVEILPSGQILLSARRQGGRIFNVFTYGTEDGDKANGVGSWSGNTNGCNNGGSNGTNGEIFLIEAKNAFGEDVKLLLQSQPKGGSGQYDRKDVTIWYKEITDASYTSQQIATDWTEGIQVSHQKSAYSAMTLQEDGKIAFFFEEAPCYDDNHEKGYCMVYLPLTIEEITKNKYFSLDFDFDTERDFSVVLTDTQGNEYRDQVTSSFGGIATALTTKYPFITIGDNANLETDGETFTYTNTVTLPFKVSNEETTVWHNIYFPANGRTECYPVYLMDDGANYVKTSTKETGNHGAQSMNTYSNADKISWAIYQAGDGFNFIFKNKLNGRYIKVNDDPVSGRGNNTQYTTDLNEAVAFGIVDGRNNSYVGEYGISFNGGQLTVYSVDDKYVSYSTGTAHQGGWVKIVEAPDFETLFAEVNAVLNMFGDGLGQYSQISDENLAAVTAAKTAMQAPGSVKLNTLNEYKNYTSKTAGGTLNLPEVGQYFRIRGISGNYIDASSIYNNANATTGQMSMKSAETCNYTGTIFLLDKDKKLKNYHTGTYIKETREIGADVNEAGVWTFAESPRKGGKYALSCTTTNNNGSHLHDNSGNRADRCSSNCSDRHDFILEEIEPTTVTISNLGYSTLYSEVALSIPEGEVVTAYTGTLNETNEEITLTLNKVEGGTIPANTAVILKAEEDTYSFNITEKVPAIENNALRGTAIDISTSKVIEAGNGKVPFTLQPYTGGDDTYKLPVVFMEYTGETLKANKAYLELEPIVANSISIRFEGTTDIEHSTLNPQPSTQIYDLLGRRVEAITKGGIYIVNGKKVVIK